MFKTLYEWIAGKNPDPVYNEVFQSVGLITLLLSVVLAAVFYFLLGRWRPVWDKLVHWVVTAVVLVAFAAILAVSKAKAATEADADSYVYTFAIGNALYALIYFFVFSLLFRKGSIFAKRTPF